MAKQSVRVTTTRSRTHKGATVSRSKPGDTSIGQKKSSGNQTRCPACGRYK